MPTDGGGGMGRYINGNHSLWNPPHLSHLLQVPWESPIGIGKRLTRSGAQPSAGTTEVVATVQGVGKGGSGCPDLGGNLCRCGPGGSVEWVRDVGDDTVHWEGSGRNPPQYVPQDDRTETSEREGRGMGVSPAGRNNGRGGVTGSGYLHLPSPGHSHTVHCNQARYGPVLGGGEASGVTGGQAVVGTGRLGLGWNADGGLGGGMGGGEGRRTE